MAETLGKYELLGELGRGGMGVVYKGRDSESGEEVAIKALPAQLAMDPVFRQRFIREVRTLQRLDHPNIVRIYDSGHHEGSLWYAMEFVEGTDLEREIKEHKRLTPLRATLILLEVTKALAYSHAQRVIHRDIKPANIMLASDGGIKIADFGIARVTDATRMTATAGVLGTIEYMSPEQAGGKIVDERTDLYSLGVVYYQAITGRMPITGKNPSQMLLSIRTQQVDPPINWMPDLPRNISDLIMKMLEKDRATRIMSAQALQRELERIEKQLISPTSPEALAAAIPAAESGARGVEVGRLWPVFLGCFLAGLGVGYLLFRGSPQALDPAEQIRVASMLASSREYADAQALLKSVTRRSDLTAEQRKELNALSDEVAEKARFDGAARRIWAAAERAKNANLPIVEVRLLNILVEALPETHRGRSAARRLKDSKRLQKALKELSAPPTSTQKPPD